MDTIVIIRTWIRHHDSTATAVPRTTATTNCRRVVEICCGIHNDAGEVFSEDSSAGR